MKGRAIGLPPTPQLSLLLPSLSIAMGILAKRGSTKRKKFIVLEIVEIKRLSPFEYGFPFWVYKVNIASTLSWNVLQLLCVYNMVCGLILCD
jgi:hypothetical protein